MYKSEGIGTALMNPREINCSLRELRRLVLSLSLFA